MADSAGAAEQHSLLLLLLVLAPFLGRLAAPRSSLGRGALLARCHRSSCGAGDYAPVDEDSELGDSELGEASGNEGSATEGSAGHLQALDSTTDQHVVSVRLGTSAGGQAADTPEGEPPAAVGQVVWVHDDARGARGEWLPWQRGVVVGHNAHAQPLVRPVEGRPKSFYVKWNAAEAAIPHKWDHVVTSPPGWTMRDVEGKLGSFQTAVENSTRTGASPSVSRARGWVCFRMLAWHLLQPLAHWLVLADAWPDLRPLQRTLGSCVAGREALYALLTVLCAVKNPGYFLMDVSATLTSEASGGIAKGSACLLRYLTAPDRVAAAALFSAGSLGQPDIGRCIMAAQWLLDLCGVAALGAGLGAGGLTPGLMLSYSATTIGTIWAVFSWSVHAEKGSRRRVWQALACHFFLAAVLIFVAFDLAELDEISAELADGSESASGSGGDLEEDDGGRTHYLRAFVYFLLIGLVVNMLKLGCAVYLICFARRKRQARKAAAGFGAGETPVLP